MLVNSISLIILFTAVVTFLVGVLAFLGLLGILASTRDIFSRRVDATTGLSKNKKNRKSIINFFFIFLGGLVVGAITLGIAYYDEGNKNLVAAILLIAGGVVSLETITIFMIFLVVIMLASNPQRSSSLNSEEIVKQTVVILAGALVSGVLLAVVYHLDDTFVISSFFFRSPFFFRGREIVGLITITAGVITLFIGLMALIILMMLTIFKNVKHQSIPLWAVFGVGIIIGGLLLFLTQRLLNP